MSAVQTRGYSVSQLPPIPQGSSAPNWSNDFLRTESGVIWEVNATWTANGCILFQNQRFTPEQFRKMLIHRGISKNTPISILQEPGVMAPGIEWQRFYDAGYKSTRFSVVPAVLWWRYGPYDQMKPQDKRMFFGVTGAN
jgi:hypothetical protein